ncbi:MAG: hypothetical protein LBD48_03090, partial [Treponema sp.]|nr:hypothetical protein [Treponema sp.]
MKRKQTRKALAAFLAALVAVLGGCSSLPGSGTQDSSPKEAAKANVKWDNDSGGYLTVYNDVNEDLILFAGSINNRNILGGVRKLESRRIDFFDKVAEDSGTFLLRAIKEPVYRSSGSNVKSDDILFASLVVFNKNDARPITVNVQKYIGGEAEIIIQNDTAMALQIRVDNLNGPVVTTLAPMERNKKIYMDFNPQGYMFFPVYQYYDRTSSGIRSIQPKSLADGIPMMPEPPRPGRPTPVVNFDATPANMYSPFAALIVTNETSRGAYILQGSSRMINQNGTTMVNPGTETYELNLQKQPHLVLGGLKVDFSLGQANVVDIPEFDYKAEYNYRLR